uniref:Transposase n=1 Tax=Heterorhabditis bacteriophora TaxID=37862 RepID=A0A1I7W9K4_HETBA
MTVTYNVRLKHFLKPRRYGRTTEMEIRGSISGNQASGKGIN